MNIKNKIWTLSAMYLSDEMNDDRKKDFCNWIENDLSRKKEFEMMKKVWKNLEYDPATKHYDSGKAWEILKSRLEKDGLFEDHGQSRSRVPLYLVRIAASIMLVLFIGLPSLYLVSKSKKNATELVKYEAKDGSSIFNLPDGSRIFLNEGSQMTHAGNYKTKRSVNLSGEAYFVVNPDPSNPFNVIINNSVITVTGTSFNVKEIKTEKKIEVFVESGEVRLENKDNGKNSITLMPGQLGESTDNATKYGSQKDLNYLSWKTREFKFIDVRLEEIFITLENAYHVKINSDLVSLSDKRLTSSYSQQTIDVILETICTAFNLNYAKNGKEYKISNN
jgi:ferric-dicitrate binding protein FerR (iron transport regulator)